MKSNKIDISKDHYILYGPCKVNKSDDTKETNSEWEDYDLNFKDKSYEKKCSD